MYWDIIKISWFNNIFLKSVCIIFIIFVAVILLNWQYWTSLTIVGKFLSLCIRLLMERLNSAGLLAYIVSALPSFSPHNMWIFVCVCVNDCACSLGFERSPPSPPPPPPPPPPLLCSSPPQMSHQLCTGPGATHTNTDERDTAVINILFGVFTHISSPSLKLWRRTIRTQKEPQS